MANEEFFKLTMDPYVPWVFRQRDYYTFLFVEGWVFAAGYVYFCYRHAHRWTAPSSGSYFVAALIMAFNILTALFAIPQWVKFTPGAPTCVHAWGIGFLSIRRTIPVTEIEGIILDTKTREKFVHAQMILKWRVPRMSFTFATYQDREFGIRRAKFVSELTGLPLLTLGRDGATYPYVD